MSVSSGSVRLLASNFNDLAAVTYGYQFDRLAAGLEEAVNAYNLSHQGDPEAPLLRTARYEDGPYCEKHIAVYSPNRADAILEIRLFKDSAIPAGGAKLDARFDYETAVTLRGDGTRSSSTHSTEIFRGFHEINNAVLPRLFLPDGMPVKELIDGGPVAQPAAA